MAFSILVSAQGPWFWFWDYRVWGQGLDNYGRHLFISERGNIFTTLVNGTMTLVHGLIHVVLKPLLIEVAPSE